MADNPLPLERRGRMGDCIAILGEAAFSLLPLPAGGGLRWGFPRIDFLAARKSDSSVFKPPSPAFPLLRGGRGLLNEPTAHCNTMPIPTFPLLRGEGVIGMSLRLIGSRCPSQPSPRGGRGLVRTLRQAQGERGRNSTADTLRQAHGER